MSDFYGFEAHLWYEANEEFPYHWELKQLDNFGDFVVVDGSMESTEAKAITAAEHSANELRKAIEYGTKVIKL